MKNLLTFFLLINIFSTYAADFKQSFYDLVDNGDIELAEILLEQWESNDDGNPDLFLAKYNLLLSKAFQPEENSHSSSERPIDNFLMVLEPNDSILLLAIETIKNGVKAFPNRLDFRLAEAQAYQYANDQKFLYNSGVDILEHSQVNGCLWDWSDGVSLNTEDGLKQMLEGIHAIEYALMLNFSQDDLINLNLKYYPTDTEALLSQAMFLMNTGEYEEACSYLQLAYEYKPSDDAVMFYLAIAFSKIGEVEKEKEMLMKIAASDTVDENLKKTAQAILDEQDSKCKEIDLYRFEFNFLRDVANTSIPSTDSIELLSNKDDKLYSELALKGYTLPEEEKAIKIDVIGEGDEAIIVWTMPYPKEVPLASYIAFVPDKEANNYRLFTLERSFNWDGGDPIWILGYSHQGGHSNYGDIPYPRTPKKFVKQILKVMKSKK